MKNTSAASRVEAAFPRHAAEGMAGNSDRNRHSFHNRRSSGRMQIRMHEGKRSIDLSPAGDSGIDFQPSAHLPYAFGHSE